MAKTPLDWLRPLPKVNGCDKLERDTPNPEEARLELLELSPEACDQLPFCFSGPVPDARPVSEILTVVGVELVVVTTAAEATMPWLTCSSVFPASLFSAPPTSGATGV